MAVDNEITLSDLYISEEPSPGIVIYRSNPDLSSEDRVSAVARQRRVQLAATLGPQVADSFSDLELLQY